MANLLLDSKMREISRMFSPAWPILKDYDRDHLARIALPLGGIGTGAVALGGRGDLRDWEVCNRPAKGFTPTVARVGPFFALVAKTGDAPAVMRLLEGPLELAGYEGASGSPVANHGLPRFPDCRFAAAYPLGQVALHDDAVPLDVRIEAFNPLIPPDADRSGLPIAVLRYVLTNRTDQPVAATVVGNLPNFIGADGSKEAPGAKGNRNIYRAGEDVQGLFMTSEGVSPSAEQWGTLALAVIPAASSLPSQGGGQGVGLSYRTDWLKPHWGASLLDFWDDLAADGRLDRRPASGAEMPMG